MRSTYQSDVFKGACSDVGAIRRGFPGWRSLGGFKTVPGADRPDGFLFGNQEKSNRESVIFFHGGELLSVKWRNYKIHFIVRRTSRDEVRMPGQQEITSEVVKPTYPWMFDIENDPKELWNIAAANNWVGTAVARRVGIPYAASLKGHPNLKPGAEGPAESDPTPTELPPMDDKD